MTKWEIPVKIYFGEIEEIIKELGQLQTFKLFEGAEEVLVDANEVISVLARHVKVNSKASLGYMPANCGQCLKKSS